MARRALLIGAKTLGLQFADQDVEHMRMALEQHGYEVAIIEPIRRVINDNLDKLVDEVGQTDTVLIYFSGHAVLDKGLRLVLNDNYQLQSNRFRVDEIINALNDCKTKQKLLILDCCHANAGTQDWQIDLSENFSILTASGRLEKAKELESLQGSFFTYHFVHILNHAHDYAANSVVYLHKIYDAIDAAALAYNSEHPEEMVPRPSLLGNRQHIFEIAHLIGQQPTTPLVRWEREYRRLLLESCDILDLANLPQDDRHLATRRLELRRLYVPLRVYSEENEQRHPEFIEERLKRFEQQRDYWNHNLPPMPAKRLSIGKHLNDNQRIVILGDPGAGKSTLLRWITTAFLLRYEQNDDWQQLPDVMDLPHYRWLPVLIRCRELSKTCLNGTLTDMLRYTLRLRELGDNGVDQVLLLIEQQLESGTALLLIDGLDEISTAKERSLFCRQLERIVAKYPTTPMIVTSRIVGYREMGIRIGQNFSHVTVADLTKEDKDLFAQCWCDLTELPERKQKAAEELIAQIHGHDRIERLTNNPMLLTTMALIKRKIGRLPQRRIELYSEAVKVLLNWRSEVDEPLDSHEAEPQLQYIAYVMAERGVQQLREDEILVLIEQMRQEYPNLHALNNHTPHEFLRLLEGRTGLLFEAGTTKYKGRFIPVYEFRHLTFQEYLAGMALVEGRYPACNTHQLIHKVGMIAGLIEKKEDAKEAVVSERWRESIRLAVAAWNDNDVDQLLMTIIRSGDFDSLEGRRARLIMACQCLADEPNASAYVVQTIIRAIAHVIDQREEYYGSHRESILSQSIISLYNTHWVNIVQEVLLNEYKYYPNAYIGLIIGRKEYIKDYIEDDKYNLIINQKVDQLFDDQDRIDLYYEISNLFMRYSYRGIDGESKNKLNIIVNNGIFREDCIFIGNIVLISYMMNMNFYVNNINEIIKTIKGCIDDGNLNYSLIAYSLMVFGKYSDDKIDSYGMIESYLDNDNAFIRSVAIKSISELEYDYTNVMLMKYLNDEDSLVRESAVNALGRIRNIDSTHMLLKYLYDKDNLVRISIIDAIEQLGDDRAVSVLIDNLNDDNINIRKKIINALGNMDNQGNIGILIDILHKSDNVEITKTVIEAIGSLGGGDIFEELYNFFDSDDRIIRNASISALGNLYDERIMPLLFERLLLTDEEDHWYILSALQRLEDNRSVIKLIDYLKQCDEDNLWYVASILGDLGDKNAVDPLLNLLENDNIKNKSLIIYALGDLDDISVIDHLLMLIDRKLPYLQSIIRVLGKFDDINIFDRLIPLLSSDQEDIFNATIYALSNLRDTKTFELLIELLNNSDENKISRIIDGLGRLGDVRAVEPLIALLTDERQQVRCSTVWSLGELGDVRAVEPLIALLADGRQQVRCSTVWSLGELGDVRAVEPLIALLADGRQQVRCGLVKALGRLGDVRAVEPLIALLADGRQQVRCSTIESLYRLGDMRAVEPLIALLADGRGSVLCLVIEALGGLGNQDLIDKLLEFLMDGRQVVCSSTVYALARLGDKRVLESLVKYQHDPRIMVRMCVAEAFRLLGVPKEQPTIFSFLTHCQKKVRILALSLIAQSYDNLAQKLLTTNFDAEYGWIDPLRTITERFVKKASRLLRKDASEIKLRYEHLASELGLKLEWAMP